MNGKRTTSLMCWRCRRHGQLLRGAIGLIAALMAGQALWAAQPPPRNDAELAARLAELRAAYAPYLRSLPQKADVRQRTMLADGDWRSKFEIERAEGGTRPEPPAWHAAELDDSAWERTTVPEWRYTAEKPRVPVSCILWYRKTFRAEPPQAGKRVFLVFEGVDWEAEVWLNGRKLGSHSVYFEPFRFDVTDALRERNTLAVRVIDGPRFGEPAAYWTLFPVPPADQTRYVRDRAGSLAGLKNGDTHIGSGYGIHREVYLETTGPAQVADVLVRGSPETQRAEVTVETNASAAARMVLDLQIMPENFEGRAYSAEVPLEAPQGAGRRRVTVPMPEAKPWSPETPYLYRCRASLKDGERVVDAKDALFGHRSLAMVSEANPRDGLPPGMLLLNGEPIFLRGTNVQGLGVLWYWGEDAKLRDVVLLLKAAHFNAVRSCQHVMYPEVRELLDRLGIMSEQDVGSRYPKLGEQTRPEVIRAGEALTRQCYNNPGVALISYANESHFDPTEMLRATLAVDPQRLAVPISGDPSGGLMGQGKPPEGRSRYTLPDPLWNIVICDFHPYWGWYQHKGRIWELCHPYEPGRMTIVGEYGGEALDRYETMQRYPRDWGPAPPKDADALWGHVQVEKTGEKQIVGFRGKTPRNLGDYIEASQTYQADLLSEITKAWRLSPRRIAGYFQFHFIDVLPANWPKSVVSHDLTPKKGYYEMAQLNQPVVPLGKLTDRGRKLQLWVANDRNQRLDNCRIAWRITHRQETLLNGESPVDVPACDAVHAGDVDLSPVPAAADVVAISLVLSDATGTPISRYQRDVFLKAWREEAAVLYPDAEPVSFDFRQKTAVWIGEVRPEGSETVPEQ